MLGTKTKQVNSYGRRSSRIVNVSDRRDQESAGSSDTTSDVGIPSRSRAPRRENAIIISPARPQVGLRRLKGSSRSLRSSPLAQYINAQPKAARITPKKRMQLKLESSSHTRQPLTPLRPKGIPSSEPSPGVRVKSKVSTKKSVHVSLKPRAPAIAVDIIVFDEGGNMLTQERRLSHTEVVPNKTRTAAGKGKETSRRSPPGSPPPIVISDESDPEVISPKPVVKRSKRKHPVVVVSSDESEVDNKGTVYEKHLVPLVKSYSRSESLQLEVVGPSAPSPKPKVVKSLPSTLPLAVTPPRTPVPPILAFRPGITSIPSLLAPPIPTTKPRQLTPIRGGPNRLLFRRPPPTPSTPTEADLSLDLAQLNLSNIAETDGLVSTHPGYLLPLLIECAQTSPYEFSAFIETFPFDPIVQSSVEDEDTRFRKIGEASYSEVFGIGDVVLKVIPIRSEEESMHPEVTEIPAPSDARDVLKEIIVTREIGEICDKFVKLLKTYVVRGRYPSLFLDLWDEYNERKGSESVRPDTFGLMQIYVIIILPNGGPDLESFAFKNISKSGWCQACGIFWQVSRALEQVERLANFEHRDLHWGQILVKNIPTRKLTSKCSSLRVAMDDSRFGVKITIIDLGLSRMSVGDTQSCNVYWTPFDEEIFEGEGDYQYDIYRMTRDLVGCAWKSYHPFTNVMWLHYLVIKLLHEKRLRRPAGRRQTGGGTQVVSSTGYNERECYDCLVEMEQLLGSCITLAREGKKTCRKTAAPSSRPKSARDVIAYGKRRGWVQ